MTRIVLKALLNANQPT